MKTSAGIFFKEAFSDQLSAFSFRSSAFRLLQLGFVVLLISAVAACSSGRYENRNRRTTEPYRTQKTPAAPAAAPAATTETTDSYEIQKELAKPVTVTASWYGSQFHGRPTASGERFDMYALTCAHKELAFGTMLKVTNTANNKSARCTVNDRGPFIPGREIDLSFGTAKEIGMIGTGTSQVRLEFAGRDAGYIKTVKYVSTSATGPFTIQFGSFREIENARHLKAGLEMKYREVYITEAVINGSTFYRVRAGKFRTKEEVSRLAKTLAEEGYSPMIMPYDERV